ncbi:MAG: FAD-dependent oxidoreductase [Allosphingosinicella sp.]
MIGSAPVVGGGIVGLVTARALALRGVKVTLLERKDRIEDEGGIGIGLQNNAMNALAEIGIAQNVVDQGVPVDSIQVYAPDGRLLHERPTDRWCGSEWPGYTGISRSSFHAILVAAAAEAGVELVTGLQVAQVDPASAAVRTVAGDRFSADLLIGADGIYSTLREAMFPEHVRAQPMGEGVWRARIPNVRNNRISMMFGAGVGTIGLTPLRDDTYLYVVDRNDRAPPRDAPDLAERLRALIGHVPGFPDELTRQLSPLPGDVTYRALETARLPPPWHQGKAILIGDSAHAGPPTLAQGAAMGIEDGVVLAKILAEASNLDSAFAAFMARRWPRVSTIVDASVTISRAQMVPGGQAAMTEANKAAAAVLALPC